MDLPAAAEQRGVGHDSPHLAALVDFMEVAGWIERDPGADPIGRGEVGRGVPVSYPHARLIPTERRSTAVVEGVREVSQETLNTVLAGVAALTGVVGILLTVRFNRQRTREREEDRLLAQEQLELAREQSARLPELVVTGVRLVGVDEVGEVHDLVREVREDRAQEEAARKAKEAKRRELEGVSPLQRDVEMWSFEDRQRSARYVDPLRYEGPLPNRVVLVDIANRGRTTAFEISGALYFEAEYLEPLGYFSGVEGDVHLQEGAYGMEVGEARDIMLTPGSSRSLIVAVKVRRTGTARVSYDLSSPTGSSTGDTLEIELH